MVMSGRLFEQYSDFPTLALVYIISIIGNHFLKIFYFVGIFYDYLNGIYKTSS